MKTPSAFEFSSYKLFMEALLVGNGRRGQLSRAAETLNCQVSFLSRVIKSEAHITLDQAFMLGEFWRLPLLEKDYFRSLVEWERAGDATYKKSLSAKLAELKKRHESLSDRTKKDDFALVDKQATYFSSWHWAAIHFLVAIPAYQTVKALSARTGLKESVVLETLKRLKEFGLVSEANGKWKYASGQFHLPKNSPFVPQHHANWRSRAALDSQNSESEGVHYTTVLTLSRADAELIKTRLLDFISETVEISAPSDPEEAVVLNCDLFQV